MAYNSSICLVGLGGTGANVIETFINNRKELLPILKEDGTRVSCMAVDVADPEIKSLENSFRNLSEEIRSNGISPEKITLIAKSVKFPTRETMFRFVRDYPEYLRREGDYIISEDYKPWLATTVDIPPLAGGVGRKRALSKAIYGLNYYLLRLLSSDMETFRERIIQATGQPIIFVIYGLGGGSGSGMVADFTRHLRKKIGNGIPIIGLCVLPCPGDDAAAKGAAAYSTIMEHSLMLDRGGNAFLKQKFGEAYENPFTAFLVMPLGPAFSKSGDLLSARNAVDEAIVDILLKSLNFDLTDLFGSIGTNVDLERKWIHALTTIRISYPVANFIELSKVRLEKLDKMRALRRDKQDILNGGSMAEGGGIVKLLEKDFSDLKEIYRQFLIGKGIYHEDDFEKSCNSLIHEDHSLETNFAMQMKGVEGSIREQVNDLRETVIAIGLDAAEGSVDATIHKLVTGIIDLILNISRRHDESREKIEGSIDDLRAILPHVTDLSPREVQLIEDVEMLAHLANDYVSCLRLHLETSALANRLKQLLNQAEKTEGQDLTLATVERIINPHLVILFSILTATFNPVTIDLRNVDTQLSNCRLIKREFSKEINGIQNSISNLDREVGDRQREIKRVEGDLKKVSRNPFKRKEKRLLEDRGRRLKSIVSRLNRDRQILEDSLIKVQGKLSEFSNIEGKFEVNSSYRRLLADIVDLSQRQYEKMTQMVKEKGFYDRTAELTEGERLKIMRQILREDESSLANESIWKEIVDKEHLRSYLTSVMSVFRIPSILGLTPDFRTDLMWATIVAPRGIWNADLDGDLRTALAGYIDQDAGKSIVVRQVESEDPWTIRFLVIASKATPEMLESYKEMKFLYEQCSSVEKLFSRSFLLEQGIHISDGMRLVPNEDTKNVDMDIFEQYVGSLGDK